MSNIVVVGSSNTDMVLYVPDIPTPGQTISGNNFTITGGGKGANQVVAAAQASNSRDNVYFIACVGDDSFGEKACENFKNKGIVTDYIVTVNDCSSGTALIFVSDSGENSIGINPGANACLSPKHIDNAKKAIIDSDYMLTQLESPIETIEYAFKIAKDNGTKIILNPAPACELPDEMLGMVDYFTPNQSETGFYTGIVPTDVVSAIEAAKKLHLLGIDNVIITMGEDGVFYSCASEKTSHFIPARVVTAIDTVAAGDAFNGAFVVAMASNLSTLAALEFATTAAAIAVTRKGAQESIPEYQEIIDF